MENNRKTRSKPISPTGFKALDMNAPERRRRKKTPAAEAAEADPGSNAPQLEQEGSKTNKRTPKKQAASDDEAERDETPQQQRERQQQQTENMPPPEQRTLGQSELPQPSAPFSESSVPSAPTFQPSIPPVSAPFPSSVPADDGVFSSLSMPAMPEHLSTSSQALASAFSTPMGMGERPIAPSNPSLAGNAARIASRFPTVPAPDRRRSYPPAPAQAPAPASSAQGRRMSFHAHDLAPSTPRNSQRSTQGRVIAQTRSPRSITPNSGVIQNSPSNAQPASTASETMEAPSPYSTPETNWEDLSRPLSLTPVAVDPHGSPACPCCKERLVCPYSHVFTCTPPDHLYPKHDPLINDTPPTLDLGKRRRSSLNESEDDASPQPAKRPNTKRSTVAYHRIYNTVPYKDRLSRRLRQQKQNRANKALFLPAKDRPRYLNESNKENVEELTATVYIQPSEHNPVTPTPPPQPPRPVESPRTEPTGPTEPTEPPRVEEPPIMEPPHTQASRWNIRGILSAVPHTLSRVFPRHPFRAATTAPEQIQQIQQIQPQPAPAPSQNEAALDETRPAEVGPTEARATDSGPTVARFADPVPFDTSLETLPLWARYDPCVVEYPLPPEYFLTEERTADTSNSTGPEPNSQTRVDSPTRPSPLATELDESVSSPAPANVAPTNSALANANPTNIAPVNAASTTPTTQTAKRRKRRRGSPGVIRNTPESSYGVDTTYVDYSSTDDDGSDTEAENRASTDNLNAAHDGANTSSSAHRSARPKKRVRFAMSPENTPSGDQLQTFSDARANQDLDGPTASGALLSTPSRSSQPRPESYYAPRSVPLQGYTSSEPASPQPQGFRVPSSPYVARAEASRPSPSMSIPRPSSSRLQVPGRWPSASPSTDSQVHTPPSARSAATAELTRVGQAQASSSALSTPVSQARARSAATVEPTIYNQPVRDPPSLEELGITNRSGTFMLRYADFSSDDDDDDREQTHEQRKTEESSHPTRSAATVEPTIYTQPVRDPPTLEELGITNRSGTFMLRYADFSSDDDDDGEQTREQRKTEKPAHSTRSAPAVEPAPIRQNQAISSAPSTPVAQTSRINSTGTLQAYEQQQFERIFEVRLRQALYYEECLRNHSSLASPGYNGELSGPMSPADIIMGNSDEEEEQDEWLNSLSQHQRDILQRWERANAAYERLLERQERLQEQLSLFQWPQPAALAGVPLVEDPPVFGGVVSFS